MQASLPEQIIQNQFEDCARVVIDFLQSKSLTESARVLKHELLTLQGWRNEHRTSSLWRSEIEKWFDYGTLQSPTTSPPLTTIRSSASAPASILF